MSESVSQAPETPQLPSAELIVPVAGVPTVTAAGGRRRSDFLYYGLRNKKLVFGLGLELVLVLFAIIGPMIAKFGPEALTGAQL